MYQRREIVGNKALLEMVESYQARLSLICKKFNNAVDTLDIIKWLKNFPAERWDDALNVLSMVEYIDDSQIIEAYDYCLQQLLGKVPLYVQVPVPKGRKTKMLTKKTRLLISPIGDAGKSSWAMVYFLKKTKTYQANNHRFEIVADSSDFARFKTNRFIFILLDDYFGSGGSALKHYQSKVLPNIPTNAPLYWLTVVSQQKAIDLIEKTVPNCEVLYWNVRDKVFHRDKSPFGNRNKVVYFRNFCYEYGRTLASDKPLGYENTQGMTTFSYGAPNNLLPIFWSSNRGWKPIFPRFSADRMERAREFRKETAYWLGLARTLGLEVYAQIASGRGLRSNKKEYSFVHRVDFRIFAIIRMLNQRRSVPSICQQLGMSKADYEETIREGFRRNLLNQEGKLSQYGERCYGEIAKKVLENRLRNSALPVPAPELYVPQMFRGLT